MAQAASLGRKLPPPLHSPLQHPAKPLPAYWLSKLRPDVSPHPRPWLSLQVPRRSIIPPLARCRRYRLAEKGAWNKSNLGFWSNKPALASWNSSCSYNMANPGKSNLFLLQSPGSVVEVWPQEWFEANKRKPAGNGCQNWIQQNLCSPCVNQNWHREFGDSA